MTANEKSFQELLAQYVPIHSAFYERVNTAYNVLRQVAMKLAYWNKTGKEPDHGITFFMRADKDAQVQQQGLDAFLEDSIPYNGEPHSIYDNNFPDIAASKRTLDGACIIDDQGYVSHANVLLPMDHVAYKQKYGIAGKLQDFLDEPEGLGARKISALYASDKFDDEGMLLTLHEKNAEGQNEISVWYRGARIYNSAGREMKWDMAHFYPLPPSAQRDAAWEAELEADRREAEAAAMQVAA